MSFDPFKPNLPPNPFSPLPKKHTEERATDAVTPQWVHQNTGRNRAQRRAAARQRRVRTAPATNRPYESKEG